jgi:hypothetical protein
MVELEASAAAAAQMIARAQNSLRVIGTPLFGFDSQKDRQIGVLWDAPS